MDGHIKCMKVKMYESKKRMANDLLITMICLTIAPSTLVSPSKPSYGGI